MKKSIYRIFAGAMSLVIVASVLSACGESSESGAKQMLVDIAKTSSETVKNYLNLISDSPSELKSGGKANVTIKPGDYLDELIGSDIKEISLDVDAKLKGKVAGAGMSLSYDGEGIADIDTVYDGESENMYYKIVGLSDKYIKTSLREDETESILSDLESMSDIDFVMPQGAESVNAVFDKAVGVLKSADISGIVSDVDSVITAVDKALPEAEESGKKTVKKNGIEAVFETEKFSFNDEKVDSKCTAAAKEALLEAENIKAVVSQVTDYEELVNNMFESDYLDIYAEDEDAHSESDNAIFFYYDDKLSGFGVDDSNYFVSADTDDGYMFVYKSDYDNSNKDEIALTAIPDGEKLDISFNMSMGDDTAVSLFSDNELIIKINDFEIVNSDTGTYNAEIEAGASISIGEGEQPMHCAVRAKCKGDDRTQKESGEVLVEENKKEKNLLSYDYSFQKTDASDIKIPDDSECVSDEDAASEFSDDKFTSWIEKISKVIGVDLNEKIDEWIESGLGYYDDSFDEYSDIDYDNEPLYDLMDNYGVDFWDYYDDDYTEFNMDKFLADAKKVYPAEKMDALKEQIEEEYKYYLNNTPNLDALYDDYGIDYWDYYDDDFVEFDMDKFLADAKKVYPAEKMDDLKKEIETEVSENE